MSSQGDGGTRLARWLLPAAVTVLWLLTMPGLYYRGDNFVARAATISLVRDGSTGIAVAHAPELADLLDDEDKFFVLNHRSQRLFSKYGSYFTLVYLPPVLAELLLHGGDRGALELLHRSRSLLLLLNLYNLGFCLLSLLLLQRLARRYSRRGSIVTLFVVLSCATTYLWYYLRSPTLEIYHIPLFLGWVLCCLRYLDRDNSRFLVLAGLLVLLLIQTKSFFILLLLPLWLLPLLRDESLPATLPALRSVLLRHRRHYLTALLPVTAVAIVLMLLVNLWKFGSMLETGYTDKIPFAELFSPRFIPHQALHYLVLPGNYNLFLHAPLLLLALLGFRRFWQRYRCEARFLGLTILLYLVGICCYNDFGEYCYGPRLLVHVVLIATLPAVLLLETWVERLCRPRPVLAAAAGALVAAGLGCSMLLQVWVCSVDYFVVHDSQKLLQPLGDEAIDEYYDAVVHRGLVCRDLRRHLARQQLFPPLAAIQARPASRSLLDQYSPAIDHLARLNLFWAAESGPGRE